MYNRDNDLIEFNNSNKSYFGLPQAEVNFFFDNEVNAWFYEYINNNDFNLSDIEDQGVGFYLDRCFNENDYIFIGNLLSIRFPDAVVNAYESADHWMDDKQAGCYL